MVLDSFATIHRTEFETPLRISLRVVRRGCFNGNPRKPLKARRPKHVLSTVLLLLPKAPKEKLYMFRRPTACLFDIIFEFDRYF